MSIYGPKLIAGAMLAFAGSAMANTSLDGTSTGDLFLNIVNTTNNTSYLFDTGVSQAAFNGNGSYNVDLSGDTNLTSFLATSGGVFYYSVVSGAQTPAAHVDITGNIAPVAITATKTGNARAAISVFASNANSIASTSTSSVILNTSAASWNNALAEGVVSKQLFGNPNTPYSDQAALDTALNFYSLGSTSTQFASQWDFISATDHLTYGPQGSPVPLPAPVLLLASALGFMGVVSRRKKAA